MRSKLILFAVIIVSGFTLASCAGGVSADRAGVSVSLMPEPVYFGRGYHRGVYGYHHGVRRW